MNFIEIQEGKHIRIDNIEALESIDQLHTRVVMQNGGIYEAFFPCDILLDMLQRLEDSEKEVKEEIKAVTRNFGFFAG